MVNKSRFIMVMLNSRPSGLSVFFRWLECFTVFMFFFVLLRFYGVLNYVHML